jgi:hypothetical protein
MFGFEQQMQIATAMVQSFTEAANGMAQASTAFWTGKQEPDPARSWYRKPSQSQGAFDWGIWSMPSAPPAAPWNAWASTTAWPASPYSANAWSGLAAFAQTMAALQPMQAFWMSMIPGAANQSAYHLAPWQNLAWPFAQQMTEMAKAAQASSYAIYRSESGHATAQVLFPGQSTPGWGNTRLH